MNISKKIRQQFVLLGGLIKRCLPVSSVSVYEELERLITWFDLSQTPSQVLYLGDSVVERVSNDDTDKRTLDKMLADVLGDRKSLVCISHSAYHPKIYFYLLSAMIRMRHKPELVVLPVNPRSFSPQWDFDPSWQFEQEVQCLQEYINGRPQAFIANKMVPRDAYEKFNSTSVHYPLSLFRTIGQFRKIIAQKNGTDEQRRFRSKQLFIFHYLHPLVDSHPKVQFLVESVKLLLSWNVKLLIYITPVNYNAGVRFVGEEFIETIKSNMIMLQSKFAPFLSANQAVFKDYSFLLSDRYFFNLDNPTEHLNQAGRLILVSKLGDDLLDLINFPQISEVNK